MEVLQHQPAAVRGDLGPAGGPRGHRRRHGRDRAAGVAAGDRDVEVDAGVREHRGGGQLLGLAEEQVREGQRVDAHVEQRARAELRGRAAGRRAGVDDEAELGVQVARGAERALAESVAATARTTGWHAVHIASISSRSRRSASANSCSASRGAQRDRLLAEHVLAGLEGGGDVLDVQRVRRRDVDRVDGLVGEQLLVRAVRRREAVLLRERRGSCLRARADRGELGVRHQPEVPGEGAGDASGPENPPTCGHARHRSPPRASVGPASGTPKR